MQYVYVLTNEWFPGLTKLGATTDVGERFNQLRSILPGHSVLRWHQEVKDCFDVEKEVRRILVKFAVANSHDWFSCPADVVIEQFKIYIEKLDTSSVLESLQIVNKKKICNSVDLGEYCKLWRKQIGITQSELADFCDVGIRFISEFESGKPTCQINLCLKVLNVIGIDLFAVKR